MAGHTNDDSSESMTSDERIDIEATTVTSPYKILGQVTAHDGVGVLGQNDAGSGTPIGVEGAVPEAAGGYGLYTADDARIDGVAEVGGLAGSLTGGSSITDLAGTNLSISGGSLNANGGNPSVSDDGTEVLPGPTDLDFGSNLSVTDDTDGTVTIDASGSSDTRTDVSEGGTTVVTHTEDIDFRAGLLAETDGDGSATVSIPAGGIGTTELNTPFVNLATLFGSPVTAGAAIQSAGGNPLRFNTDGGSRTLELGVPTSDGSDTAGGNVVAGHPNNTVNNSAVGVVIGGGGNDGNGENSVGANYTTVAGGERNSATREWATVGGGDGNTADEEAATVGGGVSNDASGWRSTVGGGVANAASGSESTVAGGNRNVASNRGATVAGGLSNTASGKSAIVPGGGSNTASGDNSFAAGTDAKTESGGGTTHNGAFVWGDSSSRTVRSGAADQFVVQAQDGIYVDGSSSDPAGPGGSIDGNSNLIETSTGAVLTNGGTWADNSTRASKQGIEPVDEETVLERVESLPVSEWSYEDEDARHVGPMAEDFHEVFSLGIDDKRLASLDTAGVALAAIQGLAERLEEETERRQDELAGKDERIDELEAENEQLRARLSGLEDRVASLESGPSCPALADD